MIRTVLPLALLALAACGGEAPNQSIANAAAGHEAVRAPLGDSVRVRLETEAGPITLELDHAHAPVTVENFVRYVDEHRFDGTTFYRAARTRGFEERGFIQGGIRRNYRRMLPPIRGVVVHGFPVGNTMFGHRTRLLHARKISPVTGKRIVRAGRLGNLDRLTAKTAPGRISGCSFSSRSTEWPYAAHGFAACGFAVREPDRLKRPNQFDYASKTKEYGLQGKFCR